MARRIGKPPAPEMTFPQALVMLSNIVGGIFPPDSEWVYEPSSGNSHWVGTTLAAREQLAMHVRLTDYTRRRLDRDRASVFDVLAEVREIVESERDSYGRTWAEVIGLRN